MIVFSSRRENSDGAVNVVWRAQRIRVFHRTTLSENVVRCIYISSRSLGCSLYEVLATQVEIETSSGRAAQIPL